jgi:hypothetical protein
VSFGVGSAGVGTEARGLNQSSNCSVNYDGNGGTYYFIIRQTNEYSQGFPEGKKKDENSHDRCKG